MRFLKTAILSGLAIAMTLGPVAAQFGNIGEQRRAELDRGIHRCTVAEIAIFPNRMHIVCANSQGVYYSLALSDTPYVDHVIDLAEFAMGNEGKELVIQVDNDRGDNNPGCLVSDCYRIQWVMVRDARPFAE